MSFEEDEPIEESLKRIMKNSEMLVKDDMYDSQFGSDYYRKIEDTGLIDLATSTGQNPTQSSIQRYYDESRNLSVLVPTLDPLNIMNMSRHVRNAIQTNDFSESYFFSNDFDKNEIMQRFRERKMLRSKFLEYARINDLKSKNPMEQVIGLNLMLLDKLDNIFRYNVKHYILDKIERRPQGKAFFTKATFKYTENTTKLVFTDEARCKNYPSIPMDMKNFPSTELFSIIVRVDSGGPVLLGINESDTDLSAYIELKANEEYKIEEDSALIKSINIRANTSDAVVRISGLF